MAIIVLVTLNLLGDKSYKPKEQYSIINDVQYETTEDDENAEEGEIYGAIEIETKLTKEEEELDFDGDRLSNKEEQEAGTDMYNSDTDGDGLTDYDELNRYDTNPLKYSTSGDEISDYIKIERNLDINRKYMETEVKPQDVEARYGVVLKPADINSQYYGSFMEYSTDDTVKSTYDVFNMLNFVGNVEYETNNKDSILLLREGRKYKEFSNYRNEDGKLIITIEKSDNYKDFIITTRENFENYKKGDQDEEKD